MKATWILGALFGAGLILSGLAPLRADPGSSEQRVIDAGRDKYVKYCASCHGLKGQGDGVLSEALKTAPPDLTQIAARRNGAFPEDEIKAYIDGRRDVKSHGAREMPVWGDRLSEEAPGRGATKEAYIKNRIALIVGYLKAIQTKNP